jgi:hypothetical protein
MVEIWVTPILLEKERLILIDIHACHSMKQIYQHFYLKHFIKFLAKMFKIHVTCCLCFEARKGWAKIAHSKETNWWSCQKFDKCLILYAIYATTRWVDRPLDQHASIPVTNKRLNAPGKHFHGNHPLLWHRIGMNNDVYASQSVWHPFSSCSMNSRILLSIS